jgi:hypothetical protein
MTADHELLQPFLRFSASVTAFSEFDLLGTGQAEAFLETVQDQVGKETLRGLLDACGPLGEDLGLLAKSIIKLWYAGIWYEPEGTGADAGQRGVPRQRRPDQDGREAPFVVSSAAYAEGLLWRAIGAHPAGAKAPGYGSWALPPTIEDYPGGGVR